MLTRIVMVLVLGLVLLVVTIVVLQQPEPDPSERALRDLRSCERRVGIPSPFDPTYQAVQQARHGAYVACMVSFGYTSQTMP